VPAKRSDIRHLAVLPGPTRFSRNLTACGDLIPAERVVPYPIQVTCGRCRRTRRFWDLLDEFYETANPYGTTKED